VAIKGVFGKKNDVFLGFHVKSKRLRVHERDQKSVGQTNKGGISKKGGHGEKPGKGKAAHASPTSKVEGSRNGM